MEFAIVTIVFLYMIIGSLIAGFWYIYTYKPIITDNTTVELEKLVGMIVAFVVGMTLVIYLIKGKDEGDNEENALKEDRGKD